jgi:hypothetical protein
VIGDFFLIGDCGWVIDSGQRSLNHQSQIVIQQGIKNPRSLNRQ